MTDKIFITQAKKEALEAEMKERKTETRAQIAERVKFARSLGDLSENAEYHSAREEQGKNESRIQEIEATLKYAEIVEKTDSTEAQMTSVVVVKKKGDTAQREFELVSPTEADMASGKMSVDSPIGAALLGKSVGDTAVVVTPNGSVEYEVLEVK